MKSCFFLTQNKETAFKTLIKINDIIIYKNNFTCTLSKKNGLCNVYDIMQQLLSLFVNFFILKGQRERQKVQNTF